VPGGSSGGRPQPSRRPAPLAWVRHRGSIRQRRRLRRRRLKRPPAESAVRPVAFQLLDQSARSRTTPTRLPLGVIAGRRSQCSTSVDNHPQHQRVPDTPECVGSASSAFSRGTRRRGRRAVQEAIRLYESRRTIKEVPCPTRNRRAGLLHRPRGECSRTCPVRRHDIRHRATTSLQIPGEESMPM